MSPIKPFSPQSSLSITASILTRPQSSHALNPHTPSILAGPQSFCHDANVYHKIGKVLQCITMPFPEELLTSLQIEMRNQPHQSHHFPPSPQQQQQQSQAQITPTLVPRRRVDESLQALQPQRTTQQRQLQMPMFICHTISEDRIGSQESVMRQQLSALGARCRKRKMQEFSHSLVREETDPMEGMLFGQVWVPTDTTFRPVG